MTGRPPEQRDHPAEEKKKPRPKDVFGRPLPTEEEFGILKNAPRYLLMLALFQLNCNVLP